VNENQTNIILLKSLYTQKKKILLATVIFALLAIGFTFFIPKKYTALGIVYPTSSNSIKDVVAHPDFGYEIHSDRLIQLFQSRIMQDWVTQNFDLISYYEIDTSNADWVYSLDKKYHHDISFSRNKYLSVEIEVNSKNPQRSADMVNGMIHYVDTIRRDMFLANTTLLVQNLEKQIAQQEDVVNTLLIQIFNSVPSSERNKLSQNTEIIIQERKNKAIQQLGDETVLNSLKNNYSIAVEKLINDYYHELGILNALKRDLTAANEKINLPFPGIYEVTLAVPDGKKTSPSTLKNGIIGGFAGFIFSLLFFVFQIKLREIQTILKDD